MKIRWISEITLTLPRPYDPLMDFTKKGEVYDVPPDFAMHNIFKGNAKLAEEKVKVQFTKDYPKMGYLRGEVDILSAKEAETLLRGGYVIFLEDPKSDLSRKKIKLRMLDVYAKLDGNKVIQFNKGECYYFTPEEAQSLVFYKKAEYAEAKAMKVKFLQTMDVDWQTYEADKIYELDFKKALHLLQRGKVEPVETVE